MQLLLLLLVFGQSCLFYERVEYRVLLLHQCSWRIEFDHPTALEDQASVAVDNCVHPVRYCQDCAIRKFFYIPQSV